LQISADYVIARLMKPTRTPRSPFPRSLPLAALLLPAALLAAGCAAPIEGMEKEVKPADVEALKVNGAKANGLLVWTSARDGLPHLWTSRTDGSDAKVITSGAFTDWHPRFSPDGTRILFQRSRAEGFVRESAANAPGAWDLYTVGPDGAGLQKVAEDATWGSWWTADEIVFLRGPKIMRKKLGGEGEAKVMDTSRYALFDGAVVQQPELSRDGHFVALTLAGAHRQAGIWSIKKKTWTEMGQGSQIGWAPDGASVYWIDDTGKLGARIAREPVIAGMPADERDPNKILLVDLGGKRSRERFPRLSNDGKWLVFAAAVNDLEDDVEDFELFLWEVGTSPTSATRVTFHSTNDSWPDLFIGEPGKAPAESAEAAKAASEEAGESEKNAEGASPARQEEAGKTASPDEEKKPEAAPATEGDEEAAAPASKPAGKAKGKKTRR
jgi:Tol biopolymer transport system component